MDPMFWSSGLILLFAAIIALVISNSNLSELYFETLEKLCALLNVDVGDLLKFKPDE